MAEAETTGQSSKRIREQAADWIVRLSETGDGQAELRATCAAWRAADPRHEKIFAEIERLWLAVSPAPTPRHQRLVKGGLFALMLLLAAQFLPLAQWTADERTGVGEIRQVALADGSRLTLNSRTAVNIELNARGRSVEIISGEVLAAVAPDAAKRPFCVASSAGRACALGTRYLVRQAGSENIVTVLESNVAVTSQTRPARSITLHAGQQIRFGPAYIGPITAAPPGTGAWVSGRLVFQDTPLLVVIDALARYRSGLLHAHDEGLQRLRFTGVLSADDSEAALELLEETMPVRVRRFTRYLTWIEVRKR